MEPSKASFDFGEFFASELWKSVPEGDWAIVSADGTQILAHAPEMGEIPQDVIRQGIVIHKYIGLLPFLAMAEEGV